MNNTFVENRDVMPYEVATSMLTKPGARLSGKERRMYQRAREIHHVSTLEPKTAETRAEEKMAAATWAQLRNWHARLPNRRRTLQNLFYKIKDREGHRWALLRAQLDSRVELIDIAYEAVVEEISRRLNTGKNKSVQPG